MANNKEIIKSPHTVTTIMGMVNQFYALANVMPTIRLDCTINRRYGVAATLEPKTNPLIRYFGIGTNGRYPITDPDTSLMQTRDPSPENLDLYGAIPFRVVPVDADLSPEERANYRMRVRTPFNGQEYWCYYLKLIDFSNSPIEVVRVAPDGTETPYDFNPAANLPPTPKTLGTSDVVNASDYYIAVRCKAKATIYGTEIQEYLNVFKGGDDRYGNISEYGFYTGEDRLVTADGVDYTEAVYVQLSQHRCTGGNDMSDPTSFHDETISFEHYDNIML